MGVVSQVEARPRVEILGGTVLRIEFQIERGSSVPVVVESILHTGVVWEASA